MLSMKTWDSTAGPMHRSTLQTTKESRGKNNALSKKQLTAKSSSIVDLERIH